MTPDWSEAPRAGADTVASPVDRLLGTVVHAALARWQRAVDGGAGPSPDRLVQAARDEAGARGLDLDAAGAAWTRLEEGLRAYAAGPWPRRASLFLEQRIRHVLTAADGFAVELHLRVDRVARYQRSVAILDFKVVTPHARERQADEWQLQTYALAAPELLGVRPASVHLFIIDMATGSDLPVGGSRQELEEASARLLDAARAIARGDFGVPLPPDRPCWACGFRLECPSSLARRPPARP